MGARRPLDIEGDSLMKKPLTLQTATDYRPALLWLMGRLERAIASAVLAEFEREFGDRIPPEHYRKVGPRETWWQNQVRWSRQHLVDAGLMGSGGYGVWTITPAGKQWLEEHPDGGGDELKAFLQLTRGGKGRSRSEAGQQAAPRTPQAEVSDRPVKFTVAGRRLSMSGRRVLEQARQALAHGVPPEAQQHKGWVVDVDGQPVGVKWLFGLATGLTDFTTYQARNALARLGLEAYRQEPAAPAPSPAKRRRRKPPQEDAQRRYDLLDAELRAIRDFLDGRTGSLPSDERLCYWVYLCLTLKLYAEGWRLFALIDRSRVQKALYDYTRRFAEVCRMKAEV